jgi:hypothetical protein
MKFLGLDRRAREINGLPGSDRLGQPQSFDVVDQQSAMPGCAASLKVILSCLEPRRCHFDPVGRCNEMLGG